MDIIFNGNKVNNYNIELRKYLKTLNNVRGIILLLITENKEYSYSQVAAPSYTNCTYDGEEETGAEYVNGQYTYKYMQEYTPNGWQDISFKQGDKQMTIVITDQQGKRAELSAGFKHWDTVWTASRPPYSMNAQQKFKGIEGDFAVAASYGWPSSNILRLNLQYVNWISALDLTITFKDNNIQVTVHKNYEPDVPQFSVTIQ